MLRLPRELEEALTSARERREPNLWWQYIVGVAAFVVVNLATGATAVAVQLVAFGAPDEGDLQIAPWPSLTAGFAVEAVLGTVGFILVIRWLAERPVLELSRPNWLSEFGIGLGLGVALISLCVAIIAALGGYTVQGWQLSTGIVVGIAIGVGPGFAEEVLFRGVLLRLLDKQIGSWGAIAVSSLLFGAVHYSNGGAGLPGAAVIVVEAGLLLGGAYLLTRRLWLAIGLHTGWNFAQAGIWGSDVSGTGFGQGGLVTATLQGPDWLTGATMGLEGSAITVTIGSLAGLVMLWAAHRRGHLLPRVPREAPAVDLRSAKRRSDTPG